MHLLKISVCHSDRIQVVSVKSVWRSSGKHRSNTHRIKINYDTPRNQLCPTNVKRISQTTTAVSLSMNSDQDILEPAPGSNIIRNCISSADQWTDDHTIGCKSSVNDWAASLVKVLHYFCSRLHIWVSIHLSIILRANYNSYDHWSYMTTTKVQSFPRSATFYFEDSNCMVLASSSQERGYDTNTGWIATTNAARLSV